MSPDEIYGDEWWRDLPPEIQSAYLILGWNETAWDEGINPPSENMDWNELSLEMQDAAGIIGYTQESWDAEEAATAVLLDDDLTSNGKFTDGIENATTLDDVDAAAGANYYEDYDWAELPPNAQEAATTLGWTESLWDYNGTAWSDEIFWDDLSSEAQEAASVLGYNQASWDASGDANLESLLIAAGGTYVSTDDDYVFEVGTSNIQVSEYQILYFFASLCFLLLGVVDLAREKAPFHLLMILAGIFGVASSVYIEEDIHLSNILDCVSVHLFLFEGISLLFKDRQRELFDEEKWTKWAFIFADSQFLLGAIIDVVVSKSSELVGLGIFTYKNQEELTA